MPMDRTDPIRKVAISMISRKRESQDFTYGLAFDSDFDSDKVFLFLIFIELTGMPGFC
jgi:hypothetical protein